MEHLIHLVPFLVVGLLIRYHHFNFRTLSIWLLSIFLLFHLLPSSFIGHQHDLATNDHGFHYCCMPQTPATPAISMVLPTLSFSPFININSQNPLSESLNLFTTRAPPIS